MVKDPPHHWLQVWQPFSYWGQRLAGKRVKAVLCPLWGCLSTTPSPTPVWSSNTFMMKECAVSRILSTENTRKAPGPDSDAGWVLKDCADHLARELTMVVNHSLTLVTVHHSTLLKVLCHYLPATKVHCKQIKWWPSKWHSHPLSWSALSKVTSLPASSWAILGQTSVCL